MVLFHISVCIPMCVHMNFVSRMYMCVYIPAGGVASPWVQADMAHRLCQCICEPCMQGCSRVLRDP